MTVALADLVDSTITCRCTISDSSCGSILRNTSVSDNAYFKISSVESFFGRASCISTRIDGRVIFRSINPGGKGSHDDDPYVRENVRSLHLVHLTLLAFDEYLFGGQR